eukprot:8754469-Lingulodinium_polyedra.AAC.1
MPRAFPGAPECHADALTRSRGRGARADYDPRFPGRSRLAPRHAHALKQQSLRDPAFCGARRRADFVSRPPKPMDVAGVTKTQTKQHVFTLRCATVFALKQQNARRNAKPAPQTPENHAIGTRNPILTSDRAVVFAF